MIFARKKAFVVTNIFCDDEQTTCLLLCFFCVFAFADCGQNSEGSSLSVPKGNTQITASHRLRWIALCRLNILQLAAKVHRGTFRSSAFDSFLLKAIRIAVDKR